MAAAAGFEQKDFFEFHLYTLGRTTTLPNNSTKQIELFDQAQADPGEEGAASTTARAIPYLYPSPMTDRDLGIETNKKVDVYLEFKNDKQFGLGVPLPAGRLRVSQAGRGRRAAWSSSARTRSTTRPRTKSVRIKLGSAFDVVGERRQVDFAVDSKARWMEEEIEIKLRNHKDAARAKCWSRRISTAGATGRFSRRRTSSRRKTRAPSFSR